MLEYKTHTSNCKVSLWEAVVEDKPKSSEDFSTWYYRWLEMIRQAEQARGKLIGDDIIAQLRRGGRRESISSCRQLWWQTVSA